MHFNCKEKKNKMYLIGISVCFVAAMFLFSCYTSPLYPDYFGYDSAIFSLVGKGLTEGKELYTDLFDHKGPFIFLINAFGYLLGGRSGIFCLQCISGILTLFFLYNAGRLLRSEGKFNSFMECFGIFFPVYAVFFYTFQRGNLTEEYSLPFISCALYFFVKYVVNAEMKAAHAPKYAFVYGVCFACLAFLRLNNAVSIGAGILAIAVFLIYKKEYKNLVCNIFSGLAGILVVTIPILVYFALRGSLSEMIYATFLHNFVIAGNTGHLGLGQQPFKFLVLYFPFVVCGVLSLTRIAAAKKWRFADILFVFVVSINLVSLWIANRFPHYFTVFVPVYAVFLCYYWKPARREPVAWLIALCTFLNLLLAVGYSCSSVNDIYIEGSASTRHEVIQEDSGRIPENERGSVIGYKVLAADYLSGDIMPCYKYYTLQDTWAISNPQILTDFMERLEKDCPLWVLILPNEDNTELLRILDEHYNFQFGNEYILYYRLKNPK